MSIADSDVKTLAVKTIKALCIDAIEAANSGHPGMPMGMADAAVVLWTQFLKFDPDAPQWPDRDRFVLSAGHGSTLLYSLLHLTGYPDMGLEDLRRFRTWGSRTAGHPEYGEAGGIETTTGPLGQGFGNAVGMALAERMLASRFNAPGQTLVDHFVYAIAGDGCLMEGISSEAASLAGHLGLGKLVVLYDDNHITIDGPTEIAFTEDVQRRFDAYGWHTVRVADGHDHAAVAAALHEAQAETSRPSLLLLRTHIGHGAPTKQDTSSAHGSPLGAAEVKATKERMGWPLEPTFLVPSEVRSFFQQAADRGRAQRRAWEAARAAADPERVRRFDAQLRGEVDPAIFSKLPTFAPGAQVATRKASGAAINALAADMPQLVGGSADLAESNTTHIKGGGDVARGEYAGRNIAFGVREHGMGAILNGLSLHGGFRPFGGTFLVFSDYMRPAVRLAALMHQPVVYVWTHDSVFLGEDGPTHQPVEHAMSLRLIPNLFVVRPADATETVAAWRLALERTDGPTALLLTRQNLPVLAGSHHEGVLRGGYVVRAETGGAPDVILLATGSEVHVAVAAAELIGPRVRVVSLPTFELFDRQDAAYRESVLPAGVVKRVAIEAGRSIGWERYVGDRGLVHGIDRFGASAVATRIAQELGFTPEAFAAKVRAYLES